MTSKQHEQKCAVCDKLLTYENLYEYIECPYCCSYIYTSDQTAEDDNRSFYNSWFCFNKNSKYSVFKKKLFKLYAKKDKQYNRKEHLTLSRIQTEIDFVLQKGNKILEIGFGEGRHLLKLLESGYDAYGIDISEKAVSTFRQKFPKYKDRVQVGTSFSEKVDIVYFSALLEHIDDPKEFIDNLSASLLRGGFLIINALPVVNESKSNITISEDISFWKPCHRIIFSHRGLVRMLNDRGYLLTNSASADIYNYKLLSLHIKNGYSDIVNIRHSYIRSKTLPGVFKYFILCREAFKIKSKALLGAYIFQKQY